ncbi:hypothetical protein BGW37DRAFT_126887 [Umbelopsis sp. PMI_123]|nr:hypothetical protein BGW37DRAFT_126887 [Umbelopsis sp. PMI_123]
MFGSKLVSFSFDFILFLTKCILCMLILFLDPVLFVIDYFFSLAKQCVCFSSDVVSSITYGIGNVGGLLLGGFDQGLLSSTHFFAVSVDLSLCLIVNIARLPFGFLIPSLCVMRCFDDHAYYASKTHSQIFCNCKKCMRLLLTCIGSLHLSSLGFNITISNSTKQCSSANDQPFIGSPR